MCRKLGIYTGIADGWINVFEGGGGGDASAVCRLFRGPIPRALELETIARVTSVCTSDQKVRKACARAIVACRNTCNVGSSTVDESGVDALCGVWDVFL